VISLDPQSGLFNGKALASADAKHRQMVRTYRSIEWASPTEPGLLYGHPLQRGSR
jgi:hypothetical protein